MLTPKEDQELRERCIHSATHALKDNPHSAGGGPMLDLAKSFYSWVKEAHVDDTLQTELPLEDTDGQA